jgi:hypothetical protein
MKIVIESIPHLKQRYNTAGDWYEDLEGTRIRVSAMSSVDRECLLALHELVEAVLCRKAGIQDHEVDEFDKGMGAELDDPGSDPRAPYHRQHMIALGIETVFAQLLEVDWHDYERELIGLASSYPKSEP